jgi:hypothetical protein
MAWDLAFRKRDYVVLSLDGGKTRLEPQKLHDDWTGDNSAIIQTASGNVHCGRGLADA